MEGIEVLAAGINSRHRRGGKRTGGGAKFERLASHDEALEL